MALSSRRGILTATGTVALVLAVSSCAYFNTFYNARKSYSQALELAEQYPDDPVPSEEVLLDQAISGAAKILAVYPESRWVDDAQLLLGDALLQSGRRTLTGSGTSDFSEAMMAYASAIVMTEDRRISDLAHMGMGQAAMELGRYNDAVASLENVSDHDVHRYMESRLLLIDALLLGGDPARALTLADSLETPRDDSLAAELVLASGRALISIGMPDSGGNRSLQAGEMFGRGNGYYRALTTAADAFIQAGRPQQAVDVLNMLLSGYRSDLETAAIALLDGKARELAGDTSGAMASFRSAADLDSYKEYGAEALYLRVLLLESQGRAEDAIAELDELVQRSGDYLWIRLGADRHRDLIILEEYRRKMESSDDDQVWLYRVMIAEKRIDLYGRDDWQAVSDLEYLSLDAPDMERSLSLVILADLLADELPDSSAVLLESAYGISSGGDIATAIEERMGWPRRSDYQNRPSVILERAWVMIGEERFTDAWSMLDVLLDSRWSRTLRAEVLWALYVAAEGARMDDDILESYLTELSEDFADSQYGVAATDRLGGYEDGGSGGDD